MSNKGPIARGIGAKCPVFVEICICIERQSRVVIPSCNDICLVLQCRLEPVRQTRFAISEMVPVDAMHDDGLQNIEAKISQRVCSGPEEQSNIAFFSADTAFEGTGAGRDAHKNASSAELSRVETCVDIMESAVLKGAVKPAFQDRGGSKPPEWKMQYDAICAANFLDLIGNQLWWVATLCGCFLRFKRVEGDVTWPVRIMFRAFDRIKAHLAEIAAQNGVPRSACCSFGCVRPLPIERA